MRRCGAGPSAVGHTQTPKNRPHPLNHLHPLPLKPVLVAVLPLWPRNELMTTSNPSQPSQPRELRDPRALNAYKHGLTGQVRLVSQLEQEAFDQHCRETLACFQPAPGFETSLAQSIADDRWQLQRAATIEETIFACDLGHCIPKAEDPHNDVALAKANTWLTRGKELERIALYAHRIQRRLEKNIAMLRQLQADRKTALDQAVEEAAALAELAEKSGQTYDPAKDFPRQLLPAQFDFSTPEMARLIAHYRRLKQARRAQPKPEKRFQTAA